jgi:hypothetical protein
VLVGLNLEDFLLDSVRGPIFLGFDDCRFRRALFLRRGVRPHFLFRR